VLFRSGKAKKEAAPVAAEGETEVIECEQVRIVAAPETRTSLAIPMEKQVWARCRYQSHFEPEVEGLWVSADKGTIEAGAVEYPFNLMFEPSAAGSFETTLIVSMGECETHIPILASTKGGARRGHRHRSE
jgi:hypothetical protein